MKKNLLTVLLLTLAMLVVGCASPAPVADPAPEAEAVTEPEPVPEVVEETAPEYTLPENDMGLTNATVGDIQDLVANGEAFYLFVDGGEAVPSDYEALGQGFVSLFKDHEVQKEFYYVDESILPAEEYAILKDAIALEEVQVAEGVTTYAGLYAFENGAVKNIRHDFVPSEENTNISGKVTNFVFESDLFVNDHGWELVTYEQLLEKRDSGEKFMVYIGRDTCPYCVPFVKGLMTAFETSPANLPVYYLYTQPYKTAINWEVEGAQETWDALKAELGISGTPSLLVFENSEAKLSCESSVGSEYFGMTDSEKQVERDRLAEELELWLLEYGLTGEVA
ncbi:MAG: hypothetical protein IJC24_07330 [Clostridia bacterium]|nr:hypothetical protein [Clostridia bacterium]